MLEGHVRMSLLEGDHMREEDVFPVTHSVEIACNYNKLSPVGSSDGGFVPIGGVVAGDVW